MSEYFTSCKNDFCTHEECAILHDSSSRKHQLLNLATKYNKLYSSEYVLAGVQQIFKLYYTLSPEMLYNAVVYVNVNIYSIAQK